jgi:hypothetical protein
MKPSVPLTCEFVKSIPERLEERTLYVSMEYATVAHKCCCGCGMEVVTPLSPTDWKLTYDGVAVSLHPSIGNWSFPCRSHYWIRGSKAQWAGQMSQEDIDAGRAHDRRAKKAYYTAPVEIRSKPEASTNPAREPPQVGLWSRVKSWWSR